MKPIVSIAGDYAILACKNARFYYGYQETAREVTENCSDEQAEWCFTAEIEGHPKIKIPFSKLGVDKGESMYSVEVCLLTGIGWVLTKYKIEVV